MVIAAIDGTGGVGKSTLAIHAAHQLADRFPDGQLYVDLHGDHRRALGPRPGRGARPVPARARAWTARACPADTDEASAQFRSLVAGRRLLVVLDNAASADQVRPLLPAGPGCARAGHQPRDADHPGGATHLHLDVLPPRPGRGAAGADRRRRAGRGPSARRPRRSSGCAAVCRWRCGSPGARLAARPAWTLRTLVAKLTDARGRLDELRFGDLAVRTSFEVSYDGVPARRALRRRGRGTGLPAAERGARAGREPAGGGRAAGPSRRAAPRTRWSGWSTRSSWRARTRSATTCTTCSGCSPPSGPNRRSPRPSRRGAGAGAVVLRGHHPAGGHPARSAPPLAPRIRSRASWSRCGTARRRRRG